MKLSDLRTWLYDIIAIMLPGAMLVIVCANFAQGPLPFLRWSVNVAVIKEIAAPTQVSWLDVVWALGLFYCVGQIIQQMNYFVNVVVRLATSSGKRSRQLPHYHTLANTVFNNKAVQLYLLPQASGTSAQELGLTTWDLLDFVYSEIAPKTSEQTFISVSTFSAGFSVVAIVYCILVTIAATLLRSSPTYITYVDFAGALILSIGMRNRYEYYRNLSYSGIINSFLASFGAASRPAEALRPKAPALYGGRTTSTVTDEGKDSE